MDPVSHLVIGLGLATLSGRPLDISDPVYIASSIGAIIPDLDILWQLKGDMSYLKHHRGPSHSLVGITLTAILVGGLIKILFHQIGLLESIWWVFAGALSHCLFDIGNSYGAQFFYPLSKKRVTVNLIQIFDPVILGIFGLLLINHWSGGLNMNSWAILMLIPIYLILRWLMRQQMYRVIRSKHQEELIGLVLLPSLIGLRKWDYLLETGVARELGTIVYPRGRAKADKQLKKDPVNEVIKTALNSPIGEIFQKFTPHIHISHGVEGNRHIVKFFDLRYQLGQEFMHSATVVLDQGERLVEQIFHPYNKNRNAPIN
ncbi:MAG TPA: metal-dependent hydrolase [Bacillota bacterium]|nr:metal-dependent hydrolase [Bacillota bacterium]